MTALPLIPPSEQEFDTANDVMEDQDSQTLSARLEEHSGAGEPFTLERGHAGDKRGHRPAARPPSRNEHDAVSRSDFHADWPLPALAGVPRVSLEGVAPGLMARHHGCDARPARRASACHGTEAAAEFSPFLCR